MYAQRDGNGVIQGLFAWPNELAQEFIDDADEEVLAFLARKPEPPKTKADRLEEVLIKKGVLAPSDLKA